MIRSRRTGPNERTYEQRQVVVPHLRRCAFVIFGFVIGLSMGATTPQSSTDKWVIMGAYAIGIVTLALSDIQDYRKGLR